MKFLSIDYGEKNTGLAISDCQGKVAFPYKILSNFSEKKLFFTIAEIIEKEKIDSLVFGLSVNLDNTENPINKKIKNLAEKFAKEFTKKS